jgi:hypothetical protein
MEANAELRPKYMTPPTKGYSTNRELISNGEAFHPLTLQSLNARRMCAMGVASEARKVVYMGSIPLFTVAPTSPLVPRFILLSAIDLSRSLKNVVDSGLFGRKNKATTPRSMAGMP